MASVSPSDIYAAAQSAGIDPDLYARLVHQESGGSTTAVSPRGARGPAQLMPDTARTLGVDINDPIQNLQGGARYFRQMQDQFGSPTLAAAAYNAGPAAVQKYGGVPPFRETQAYVRNVAGSNPQAAAQMAGDEDPPNPADVLKNGTPVDPSQANPQNDGEPPSAADVLAKGQPLSPGGMQIKWNAAKGQYEDSAGAPYRQSTTPDHFINPAGKEYEVDNVPPPPPMKWTTAAGVPAAPASFDKFGNGIDAQGNILQQANAPPKPVNPAQATFEASHPPTIRPMTMSEKLINNPVASFLRGAADTASLGFANKADALSEAAFDPYHLGGRLSDRYSFSLDNQQGQSATDATNNPTAYRGGGVGAMLATAPFIGGRGVVANAAIGGALAGGSALGNARGPLLSELGQAANAVPMGVVAGAMSGLGAPKVVRPEPPPAFGVPAGPGLNRALAYVAPRVANPDPAMVAAAQGGNVPLFLQGGDPAINAVRSLARRPGTTALRLQDTIGDPLSPDPAAQGLRGGSGDRIQAAVQGATGVSPAAAQGNMDALSGELRANNVSPAYDAALNQPVNRTQQLASVLQEPEVQKALAYAQRRIGKNAMEPALKLDPDTGAQVIDPHTQQPIMELQPTAATLDLTKKYLGKMVSRDPITGQVISSGETGIGNDFLNGHLRNLTGALAGDEAAGIPAAIPGYRDALNQAGDVLSMERAHKFATDQLFSPRVTAAEFSTEIANMSPAELAAAKGGGANQMFNLAQRNGLTPKTFAQPIVRDKMVALYGQDAVDQIVRATAQERRMMEGMRAASPRGQSPTATDMAEIAAQDSNPALQHAGEFMINSAIGGPHLAATKLGLNVGAPMLRSALARIGAPSESVRNIAGDLLVNPAVTPEDIRGYMDALKNAPKLDASPRPMGLGLSAALQGQQGQ